LTELLDVEEIRKNTFRRINVLEEILGDELLLNKNATKKEFFRRITDTGNIKLREELEFLYLLKNNFNSTMIDHMINEDTDFLIDKGNSLNDKEIRALNLLINTHKEYRDDHKLYNDNLDVIFIDPIEILYRDVNDEELRNIINSRVESYIDIVNIELLIDVIEGFLKYRQK